MKRYVAYLGSRATNNIVSHGLGDWYDIGPSPPGVAQLTPLPLTATAFYYYDTWILAQAAGLLGKADEANNLSRAAAIRAAFNERFYDHQPPLRHRLANRQRHSAGDEPVRAGQPRRRAGRHGARRAGARQRPHGR